jgi:predicted amidohydrolase
MSKFLALGVSLDDVVRATTETPGRTIRAPAPAAARIAGVRQPSTQMTRRRARSVPARV